MNKYFDWNKFKKEKIAIEVLDEKECLEFLKECEKNNINWSRDKRATDFIPNTPTSIVYDFDKDESDMLGFSRSKFFEENGYKIFKWNDIKNKPKEEIIIYRNGNEVIALHKENGEIIKSTKAKCNPEDEFNFMFGAKLGFERLVNNNSIDFRIGEFVKVICKEDHYFPIGTIVEIKNIDKKLKTLRCYGYTNCYGTNGFNEQIIKMESVEKL